MNEFNRYLKTALIMTLIGLVFVLFAFGDIEGAFPWSVNISYAIFAIYGAIAGWYWGLVFKYWKLRKK